MTLRIRAAIFTIAASSLFLSGTPVLADSAFDGPVHVSRAAPADEYFGPLRLSVLGISNTIARTTLRLDNAGLTGFDVDDATKNVGLVEASVRDWEAKYPQDTWLPRMVFALHRAYRMIATEESLQHAADTASWLIARYPGSDEARAARAELARAMASTDGSNAAFDAGNETAADGTHP